MILALTFFLLDHKVINAAPFQSVFKSDIQITFENKNELSLIGEIEQILLWNNLYVVLTKNQEYPVKFFSRDGKFIKTLGRTGQGPNEYTRADKVTGNLNHLYILDNIGRKLIKVNKQLEISNTISISKHTFSKINTAFYIKALQDETLIFSKLFPFNEDTGVCISNKAGASYAFRDFKESRYHISGGLTSINQNVYYLPPLSDEIQWGKTDGYIIHKEAVKKISKESWPVITIEKFNKLSKKSGKERAFQELHNENATAYSLQAMGDYIIVDYGYFIITWNTITDVITPLQMEQDFLLPLVGATASSLIYMQESNDFKQNPKAIHYSLKKKI